VSEEKNIESLHIDVRGSKGIDFTEGWRTGGMKKSGVEISTVYVQGMGVVGGCIDRNEAKQIRDFLNKCIVKWESENGQNN